jgi:hypothetical protein
VPHLRIWLPVIFGDQFRRRVQRLAEPSWRYDSVDMQYASLGVTRYTLPHPTSSTT